jgi:ketosteroid isomerase-like protein
MSTEDEVRKASQQFYAALNPMANGDAHAMSVIWSQDATVTAMHPIGGRQLGWDRVRDSFQKVAQIASDGRIRLDDQVIQVTGDLAYELGVERGQARFAGQQISLDYRVTNVYRRDAGRWKIVHHHSDFTAALLDAVERSPVAT